jgi:hypothetical protein
MKQEVKETISSVIPRYETTGITRSTQFPDKIRDENEIAYAATMGQKPHEVKSVFKDIYEFYQNNEV